ncbi:aromatic acid exporter family protein [Thermoflavimicrobium dichotomicum]|uniref:Uncharacterized membrane protein YgaE, UPF0421/DUF939 family n=1 Tax=Thermoflavimicrobium dichotomicum TaxID=46223 RepID=A0A1I3L7C7_9BACL|nr:aromatic acid exporter family protein [Thermoflavimicrobium dichotomicum]SFI80446.1 Uncharacterized membrane protein YgaE, UPF0421/DUF939 family [Thermoflavimicrobium dichotomicum]
MKIGFRVIKTAIGTGLAIAVASWIGLKFYSSAGVLTILCLKETRKRSIESAIEKMISCIIGGLFAAVSFKLFGFTPWTITLILLMVIPVLVALKAKDSVATSSVVILHLYMLHKVDGMTLLNELGIIVVGITFALMMNIIMPSAEKQLKAYQEQVEAYFKKIFMEFVIYLRQGESDWDGKEILEVHKVLQEAKDLALKDIENNLRYNDNHYFHYFEMREKQFEIIQRIMPLVSSLDETYEQNYMIADFLENLAHAIHPGNTVSIYLDELQKMRQKFKTSPLPQDRKEFEVRAALFHFVNEMQRYLLIKKALFDQHTKRKKNQWSLFIKKEKTSNEGS